LYVIYPNLFWTYDIYVQYRKEKKEKKSIEKIPILSMKVSRDVVGCDLSKRKKKTEKKKSIKIIFSKKNQNFLRF